MDLYHKILAGAGTGLLITVGVVGAEYIKAREDQARAEERSKANQQLIDQLTKQQNDFAQQIKDLKAQQAIDLANVQRTFANTQSPQQLAALVAQLMGLKQAPIVFTPQATKENPNPTAQIELPDAPQVKAYFQSCEECKVNYAAAQKQLVAEQGKTENAQQRLDIMTTDRDQWKRTAQGGSKLQRAVKRVEHFLIDAGITAALVCGSGHCK